MYYSYIFSNTERTLAWNSLNLMLILRLLHLKKTELADLVVNTSIDIEFGDLVNGNNAIQMYNTN